MWKRLLLIALCITLLSAIPTANAADMRATGKYASLDYSGATALCTGTVDSPGKSIYVNMQLWRGSALIASWNESGTHAVSIERTAPVVKGQTYTLKLSGTCGGTSFTPITVTKTCPN